MPKQKSLEEELGIISEEEYQSSSPEVIDEEIGAIPDEEFEGALPPPAGFEYGQEAPPAPMVPDLSAPRVAALGAEQGLTAGFADELRGLLEATGQTAGVKGLGTFGLQSLDKPLKQTEAQEPISLEDIPEKASPEEIYKRYKQLREEQVPKDTHRFTGAGEPPEWYKRKRSTPSAALGAVGEKLGETELGKAYKEGRSLARQEHALAQEARPWTYLGGEVVGGLVGPAAASAAKGAKKIGTAAKAAKEIGTATKELSKAGKLIRSAKEGTKLGALYAAGYSEADLTEGEVAELLEDIAKGSAMGGVISPSLTSLGMAAKATKNAIGEIQYIKDLIGVFKGARSGKGYVAESEVNKIIDKGRKMIRNYLDYIKKATKKRGQDRDAILKSEINQDAKDMYESYMKLREKAMDLPANTPEELADKKALLDLYNRRLKGFEDIYIETQKARPGTKAQLAERQALKEAETSAIQQTEQRVKEAMPTAEVKTPGEKMFSPEIVEAGPEGLSLGVLNKLKATPEGFQIQPTTRMPIRSEMPVTSKALPSEQQLVTKKARIPTQPKVELTPREIHEDVKLAERFTKLGDAPLQTDKAQRLALKTKDALVKELKGMKAPVTPKNPNPKTYGQLTDEMHELLSDYKVWSKQDMSKYLGKKEEIEMINGIMEQLQQMSRQGHNAHASFRELIYGYSKAGKRVPGLMDIEPKLANKMVEQVEALTSDLGLLRAMGIVVENTTSGWGRATGGLGSLGLKGVHGAGKVARGIDQSLAKMTNRIKDMTPVRAQKLISFAKEKGYDRFIQPLVKLAQSPPRRRASLSYALASQPEFREFIGIYNKENNTDIFEAGEELLEDTAKGIQDWYQGPTGEE